MRLLEFVNEERLMTVVPVPDSKVALGANDTLIIHRPDGSWLVVDTADTIYLSDN